MHRLRKYIDTDSYYITDDELNEIEQKIPFDDYLNNNKEYEFSGNFIFTTSLVDREEALTHMCCGIHYDDILLSNGKIIYFAFDYGH